MLKIITKSGKETIALGRELGCRLSAGNCLALLGDFGSGKTTFVKGLAQGLGFKKKNCVSSPSFVILKIYEGRLPLYHFDLYRLEGIRDIENIGLAEFVEGGGVSVIEWADRARALLPPGSITIEFSVLGATRRSIKFSTRDQRLGRILKKISLSRLRRKPRACIGMFRSCRVPQQAGNAEKRFSGMSLDGQARRSMSGGITPRVVLRSKTGGAHTGSPGLPGGFP